MWYYEKCRDYLRYYESMFVFDENNTRKGRKHEGGRKIKMICCFFFDYCGFGSSFDLDFDVLDDITDITSHI